MYIIVLLMTKYIYMSQMQKFGYKRSVVAHAWWGKGNRLGMLADVQASLHDSTVHVQRFFPT